MFLNKFLCLYFELGPILEYLQNNENSRSSPTQTENSIQWVFGLPGCDKSGCGVNPNDRTYINISVAARRPCNQYKVVYSSTSLTDRVPRAVDKY